MTLVRVERHDRGPRLFVGHTRIHHYHCGAMLIAAGVRLMWRDRHDLPHWPTIPIPVVGAFDPEIGVTTTNATGGW